MNQQINVDEEKINIEEQIITVDSKKFLDNNGEFFDKKKFLKNVLIILISNLISVLSGILVGFIIPKILGVSEYGYYKTFTLYSSYIGLFHFGFVDGIYLKYAGKKYEDLCKEKFRLYSKFLFVMEFLISFIIILFSFFFIRTKYFYVVFFLGLNVLATNFISYFEFISQITMKFKRISLRNVIRCSLNILSVLVLYLLYKFDNLIICSTLYIIIYLSINYLLAIWYALTYRDLIFGKSSKLKEEKKEILFFFKVGIPLLFANLVGQLLFIADQQFVNVLFDNETYSTYAFAYNMINLITIATSAISVVLYPTLKKLNNETIKNNYSRINSYLLMFVAFCLLAYYFLDIVVRNFLPKYIDSLSVFRIIVPGILISSSISVIKYNCYKIFNKIKLYFTESIIVLVVAIIANIGVFLIYKSTTSISIISILVLFLWYVIVESYFIKKFKVKFVKNLVYLILIIAGFYSSTFIPNIYVSSVSYLFFYLVLTLIIFYKELKMLTNNIKRRC